MSFFCQGESIAITTEGLKRIEELERSQIKQANGQEMMEHDGEIVPIIDLPSIFGHQLDSVSDGESVDDGPELTHVAFYSQDSKSIGLIIGPVVDIAEHSLAIRGQATRAHVKCTTMIEQQLVELLDLESIFAMIESHSSDDVAFFTTGDE